MRERWSAIVLTLSLLLAGCGGSSGRSGLPAGPLPTSPATGGQQAASVAVSFSIQVPTRTGAALRRVPAYVSTATQSAALTVAPAGGSASAPTIVNCTSTCTGTITAPVGIDTFTVNLYAGAAASGSLLSTGTATQTIVANTPNAVNVTFNGVVAGLNVAFASPVTYAVSSAPAVTVSALDPAGNTIVGPGVYVDASGTPLTIALTNNDTTGATTLPQTSVTGPSDVVTMAYNGAGIFPSVSASGTGLTMATATATINGATIVTLASDTAAGTPAGTGTGAAGDLRSAITNAAAGGAIIFDTHAMCASTSCTIALNGPLPMITQNLTIDGGAYGRIAIDGSNAYRVFWADTGNVTLANLHVQNALAAGSAGGSGVGGGGGGGGAGLGACLFVDRAIVVVRADFFSNCNATGGAGGSSSSGTSTPGGAGGGGSLNGGSAVGGSSTSFGACPAGAGGAGGFYAGGNATTTGGSSKSGATGGGNTPGGSVSAPIGGAGTNGAFYQGGGGGAGVCDAASAPIGGAGGNGGFGAGGGGGGGAGADPPDGVGGAGGQGGVGAGGGGGGGSWSDLQTAFGGAGGNGVAGGGGGGGGAGLGGGTPISFAGSPGLGTTAVAGFAGGNARNYQAAGTFVSGGGGGGAAAGPVIFVYTGSVTISNSGAATYSAIGGTGGTGWDGVAAGSGTPAVTDSTDPVFNYSGTVNGNPTTGNGTGGLSTSDPTSSSAYRRAGVH